MHSSLKTVSPRRKVTFLTLLLLLLAGFFGLGFRLVQLQVRNHEPLRAEAEKNTQRTYFREARRGDIRDRKGTILARSYPVKNVCGNPHFIHPYQAEVARTLSPLLEIPEPKLIELLRTGAVTNAKGKIVPRQYVRLKPKIPIEKWEQVRQAMQKLPVAAERKTHKSSEKIFFRNLRESAVFAEDDQIREYPNGTLAAHVLGFATTEELETAAGKANETIGREGIERVFDSALRGIRGWKSTEIDKRARELVTFRDQDVAAEAGLNVVLTIDAGLQHIVETELADVMEKHTPISASAMIVRPRTGEVLSMATLPAFDPAHAGNADPAVRRNRLVSDMAEPGSTFKIVVFSAALNEGVLNLSERIDCENGRFFFAGKTLRDTHHYGNISAEQVFVKSSNIGSAKIGIRLGAPRFFHYIREFGFGEPTGISLLGEANGIVRPLESWAKISISRIPIGQGIAATPLQMVMAVSAIANKGRLMKPSIVDRIEDEDGHVVIKYPPQAVRQVIRPEIAKLMVGAMKSVVATNGTGTRARLDRYAIAGKTGTAQKPGPGGYMLDKYFSSFIGFFPADDPELCIGVVLDEPKNGYYGGDTAAPVFRNIAERAAKYLSIRPDVPAPETYAAGTGRPQVAARPKSNL